MKSTIETSLADADMDYTLKLKAESRKNRPPAYHVFTVLGEYFLFDTSTQLLYCVDELTYDFLMLCLKCSIEEAAKNLHDSNKYAPEAIEQARHDIQLLAANGLFEVPNYAMSAKKFEASLDRRAKTPVAKITLGTTESCNLACVYCYCSIQRDSSKKMLTNKMAKAAVDWLFKYCGDAEELSITFFGGEPYLNKKVIYYTVEYSKKLAEKHNKKLKFMATTNATLIDEEFGKFLAENHFSNLISLDGPPEIHDRQCPTRGGDGSYQQASEGAKRLLSYQRKSMVRCTLTKPVLRINELVDFFEQFGFGSCFLGPSSNRDENLSRYDYDEADYLDLDKQSEEMIPEILRKKSQGEPVFYNPYEKGISKFESRLRTLFPSNCGAASNGCVYINVDGTIYPCHQFYGFDAWKMGNILDDKPLPEEAQKDYWRKFRKAFKRCESCWAGLLCQGPCSAQMMLENGTFSKNLRFCESRRFVLERAGYLYYKQNLLKEDTESPNEKQILQKEKSNEEKSAS